MRRSARPLVIGALLLACATSGCAVLLLGLGAAGGYAIGKDTVRNDFEKNFGTVYRAGLLTARQMGQVTIEDERHGKIEATVEESKVWIRVEQNTPTTVRLKVKARKNLLPNIDLAQQVYNKILERL
ncbi:MAG: DUF3568 family protein [Candidatus Omnitrophica bacterium]|nr:DUF3568 family protein [Candidatus Omnitrophota bacterium]